WVPALLRASGVALVFAYFLVTECTTGCSLGKRLFRLRVAPAGGTDPPGWGQGTLRTALFCLLTWCACWFAGLIPLPWEVPGRARRARGAALALGGVLVCVPMGRGNGSRGLHEVVSGTRVLQLPWPTPPQPLLSQGGWLLTFLGSRRLDGTAHPAGLPERI